LAELGRYGPALVDMTSAIRLEPRNFFALMRRGETHLLTKNFAAAQADFEAAALIEPKNILPRVGMIRMADLMGQTAKADEMHLALLRTSEFADHNPYLVSRGKPFVAQVTRERSDNAQAARKRSADAEFDAIRGQWNPLVKCHADNLELLARASDAMGAGGSKTAWAPSISSANTPCYERASALSARAGTFRYSAAYGLLSTARQAALDELIPAIEQALADLLRARRLFGLYVK
jgi:tetratricopeptide (TPR) repeat protein